MPFSVYQCFLAEDVSIHDSVPALSFYPVASQTERELASLLTLVV